MLNHSKTLHGNSLDSEIVPNEVIEVEGAALVAVTSGTYQGVKLSTGAAGERFAGVSIMETTKPVTLPGAYNVVTDADGKAELPVIILDGTLRVAAEDGTDTTATSSTTGTTLTVTDAADGDEFTVYGRYAATVIEARNLQGDADPGPTASASLGNVGVITDGDVFTSEYDTTVDWTSDNPVVTLGANGQFTIGGTGTVVNGYVIQVPTSDDSFLGLRFKA